MHLFFFHSLQRLIWKLIILCKLGTLFVIVRYFLKSYKMTTMKLQCFPGGQMQHLSAENLYGMNMSIKIEDSKKAQKVTLVLATSADNSAQLIFHLVDLFACLFSSHCGKHSSYTSLPTRKIKSASPWRLVTTKISPQRF